MAKCRPKLSSVSVSDLITVGSFQWSHGHKIGEGSYGKVYLGWSKGNTEQADIAVKYIKKEHLTDKKVNENMQREINILKGLSDCPNVVRLWESLMRNGDMILFMELCDFDLDHYVKQSPFNQRDVKIFLSHMAEGLRVLQERGIVHRDLKPQNILVSVDPVTEKKQLKIADFGFARHFIEEGIKQSLHSMAGTPVFMAPEALRSVMTNCKTKYDAKVDLWSVGAVLYKCLVGHCGFYATLQEILSILEKKGDAIAFERKKNPYDPVRYYYELPVEVRDRLSDDFATQITKLLKSLLKVDARQRMDFAEFFACVDALTKNNIQVVDALSGSTSRMSMSQVSSTPELVTAVARALGLPNDKLVLFNEDCQWVANPWEIGGMKDDLSGLNPQNAMEENDPVVYAVTLDVSGDSDDVPNMSIVEEIGNLLYKLPQHSSRKVTESVNRLISSSAAGGLTNIQRKQLKAQRVFWSLLLRSYCHSSNQLRATERDVLQSFGNSISSLETLRQYVALLRSLGRNTQALEEGLAELDTSMSQLSKTLSVFTANMDVLAIDSTEDVTCEHQDFEIQIRALRSDAAAVGNVELSQLQETARKVQGRLKDLVCRVHASLAKGYSHGMGMLQKLSETQSTASPLQAEVHRVAKRVEALLAQTYDLLSSSVSEVSDPMVVIEVTKDQEQDATGTDSGSDQGCAACGEKQSLINKLELEVVALKEKAGKDTTDGHNMEDTLRTSVVEASRVSDSESTLQEVTQQLRDVLLDLAPSLSVPPLEDEPPESMASFVMCSTGEGSRMPVVLELKNLVGQLKDVTLGSSLVASAVDLPPDGSMQIKVTQDLEPGDLVLFMPTRDPKIYCALLYTDKARVFMDKESLERHEKDIKQSSIPGTPFILARVAAAPRKRKSGGHSSTAYEVTPMYSVKCVPVCVGDASNE